MAYFSKRVCFVVLILSWIAPQSASIPGSHQVDEAAVFDEVSLLQAPILPKPSSQTLEAAAVDEGMQKVDSLMQQMQVAWAENGGWSKNLSGVPDGCGLATPAEMQMPISIWQAKHPGVRGFCFFSNIAFWFPAEAALENATIDMYNWKNLVKDSIFGVAADEPHTWSRESHQMCANYGAVNGPEMQMTYDGLSFTWNHVRDCIDVVDDTYCYSLGWLKGQNLDGHLKTMTAAKEKAKSECEKMQDEFQFIDEEVTVGRHVMSTPVYFRKTWCSLTGSCPGITRRVHAEHVYTKCLLGADSGEYAVTEMNYCYHKGCVLEGNRIGHSNECGYDEDDD